MTLIFWILLGLVFATYAAYPIVLYLFSVRRDYARGTPDTLPPLSFVIAAFNEKEVIEEKLLNTLELDYPPDLLQIIIVCDGSDDDTEKLASKFRKRGVHVLYKPEREGKAMALNRGVSDSSGEIIVFSDANNMFDTQALRFLAAHFSDPQIGGVSGSKRIFQQKGNPNSEGEGLYWKYESFIKKMESRIGSTVTTDGEIFAVRRSLFVPYEPGIVNDDQVLAFRIISQGQRIVYDEDARTYEAGTRLISDKFQVVVRMVAGGMQAVKMFHRLFFPPKSIFAYCFIFHKLIRWFVPFLLLCALCINILLSGTLYNILLVLQLVFYATALLGWSIARIGRSPGPFALPFYFCMVNFASAFGIIKQFRGLQTVQWHKTTR